MVIGLYNELEVSFNYHFFTDRHGFNTCINLQLRILQEEFL